MDWTYPKTCVGSVSRAESSRRPRSGTVVGNDERIRTWRTTEGVGRPSTEDVVAVESWLERSNSKLPRGRPSKTRVSALHRLGSFFWSALGYVDPMHGGFTVAGRDPEAVDPHREGWMWGSRPVGGREEDVSRVWQVPNSPSGCSVVQYWRTYVSPSAAATGTSGNQQHAGPPKLPPIRTRGPSPGYIMSTISLK